MIKILTMFSFIASLIPGCRYVSENKNLTKPIKSIYDLSFITLEKEEINLSKYKGKKILIVNVASRCGFTPQYDDLEKLYQKYSDKVQVIGFPCNQFANQEPGNELMIREFCTSNYGITFPISQKAIVKGNDKHPVYVWLTDKNQNGWNNTEPNWNFCKYLIDENGNLLKFFSSKINPLDEEIISLIK